MVTYVLDASAILRYLDAEARGDRVNSLIKDHVNGSSTVVISAIHWGEVMGVLPRRHGLKAAQAALRSLRSIHFEIVPATAERAERAAVSRAQRKIPYADAFGVELAADSTDHVLVTADFDLKPAASDMRIEFLSTKAVT